MKNEGDSEGCEKNQGCESTSEFQSWEMVTGMEKSTFTYFYLGECGWQAAVPWVIKRKGEWCDKPAVLSIGMIISPK